MENAISDRSTQPVTEVNCFNGCAWQFIKIENLAALLCFLFPVAQSPHDAVLLFVLPTRRFDTPELAVRLRGVVNRAFLGVFNIPRLTELLKSGLVTVEFDYESSVAIRVVWG